MMNKCSQGSGGVEDPVHCSWECKMGQPLWIRVWRFLKKLVSCCPSNGVFVHTKACTRMFTATVFRVAKKLEATQFLPLDGWINVNYLYNGILFSNKNK